MCSLTTAPSARCSGRTRSSSISRRTRPTSLWTRSSAPSSRGSRSSQTTRRSSTTRSGCRGPTAASARVLSSWSSLRSLWSTGSQLASLAIRSGRHRRRWSELEKLSPSPTSTPPAGSSAAGRSSAPASPSRSSPASPLRAQREQPPRRLRLRQPRAPLPPPPPEAAASTTPCSLRGRPRPPAYARKRRRHTLPRAADAGAAAGRPARGGGRREGPQARPTCSRLS
mmetsp:Transcript_18563/g.44382  ORF Transcript_18563/g.44382 Transcript_18563/m.44382 type:complete len:226 (-) Transcript_18563:2184-2861(-)